MRYLGSQYKGHQFAEKDSLVHGLKMIWLFVLLCVVRKIEAHFLVSSFFSIWCAENAFGNQSCSIWLQVFRNMSALLDILAHGNGLKVGENSPSAAPLTRRVRAIFS